MKAIIHTATRVVRRVTTDAAPALAADESVVEVSTLNLSGGFWKLDAQGVRVAATPADIDAAAVDDALEAQKVRALALALRDAAVAMRDDASLPATVRAFARDYVRFMRSL